MTPGPGTRGPPAPGEHRASGRPIVERAGLCSSRRRRPLERRIVLEEGNDAMTTTYKVGYFIGSLSSTSINRVLSKALIRLAPDELEFVEIPIKNLPLYSPDYDQDYPPEATALKEAIAGEDAVLSVCNARQMTSPEAYIHYTPEVFRPGGEVTDESTAAFLRGFMTEFRDHMVRVLTVLPR